MAQPASKEEFVEWKSSHVTLWFLENLHTSREFLKEGLAEMNQETEAERLVIMGRCQAIKDILDAVKYNTFFQEEYTDVDASSTQDNS